MWNCSVQVCTELTKPSTTQALAKMGRDRPALQTLCLAFRWFRVPCVGLRFWPFSFQDMQTCSQEIASQAQETANTFVDSLRARPTMSTAKPQLLIVAGVETLEGT